MFTVHGRGVFTQDQSGYFSISKVYEKKWDREKVFTIKGCSLIRGVHYERFHCRMGWGGSHFFLGESHSRFYACKMWARSVGRVEKKCLLTL